MSKKTILTILGSLVICFVFLPMPAIYTKAIYVVLGILIIFFTRAKVATGKQVGGSSGKNFPRKI